MFVFMTDFSKNKCDTCGGIEIIQVEYPHDHPEHYDGISETVCMTCAVRIGRWSGKKLGIGEYEKRYGLSKFKRNLIR